MGHMDVFKNVDDVELFGMPSLSLCILMNPFQSVRRVSMTNAGAFEKDKHLVEWLDDGGVRNRLAQAHHAPSFGRFSLQ